MVLVGWDNFKFSINKITIRTMLAEKRTLNNHSSNYRISAAKPLIHSKNTSNRTPCSQRSTSYSRCRLGSGSDCRRGRGWIRCGRWGGREGWGVGWWILGGRCLGTRVRCCGSFRCGGWVILLCGGTCGAMDWLVEVSLLFTMFKFMIITFCNS